jgi:hypothetical protein
MRSMLLAVLAMSFLFTTGCAVLGGRAAGSIYTDTKYGFEATGHKDTSKMGKACTQSILGAIATGDASISAAKQAAGITKLSHVDETQFNVLGIYGEYCTIVRGS